MLADKLRPSFTAIVTVNVPVLTFEAGVTIVNTTATHSFNNVSIGTADADRYIAVAAMNFTDVSASTGLVVTIAGVTASAVAQTQSTRFGAHIFISNTPVSTGSTTSVTFSRGGTALFRSAAAVYSIVKPVSAPQLVETQTTAVTSVTWTANDTPSTVGITVATAFSSITLTDLTITGVATSDYYAEVSSGRAGRAATVSTAGTFTWQTTGAFESMRAAYALWS